MSRIARLVPATVLAVAALALIAPAAQAKPVGLVSPIVQSVHNAKAKQATSVVTTGDKPLANPVQIPETLGVGLMHASTAQKSATPISVSDSPSNGIDWTAAALGAIAVGSLSLMFAAGVTFRRRGQLAA